MPEPPRVQFRLDSVLRGLSVEAAAVLEDWVWMERSLAANKLAGEIRTAMTTEAAPPIELNPDTLIALRTALCDADVGDDEELALLRDTFCGPALDSD